LGDKARIGQRTDRQSRSLFFTHGLRQLRASPLDPVRIPSPELDQQLGLNTKAQKAFTCKE
jgi:hypothetical protein